MVKSEQLEAVRAFLEGQEVFIWILTGSRIHSASLSAFCVGLFTWQCHVVTVDCHCSEPIESIHVWPVPTFELRAFSRPTLVPKMRAETPGEGWRMETFPQCS